MQIPRRKIDLRGSQMKEINLTLISLLFLFLAGQTTEARPQSPLKAVRIGAVIDGPWDRNKEVLDIFKKEVSEALSGIAAVSFAEDKILVGDWTVPRAVQLDNRLLADPDVDLVVGFGVFTSRDLATRGPLPKPVIAPIVVSPLAKNVPFHAGTSGVQNLSYLLYPGTFERDYRIFQELVPFKKLIILASRRYYDASHVQTQESSDEQLSKKIGAQVKTILFDNYADSALSALPKDADAVYLDVVPMPLPEFDKLVQGLVEKRLPSFSFLGEVEVKRGIMAAANPDIFPRLVRRIALNIQRIVLGEEPGSLAVAFSPGERLFLNLATASAVGVSPKWMTLMEAELVQLDSSAIKGAPQYTLETALHQIDEANLDLQVKVREVTASAQDVTSARANLLPRIDVSALGSQIDKDRAQAGYQPERRGSVGVSASQVIFSEPALANLSIQSSIYDSHQSDLESARLNTISEGARTYLNYLRARSVYYILLDNLKLTRSNLELARIRQSTGAAGQEEPLRWEVEIASIRKAAIEAHSRMSQALLALKQVLNVPLVYLINVADVSLDDPELFLSRKELVGYLEDPVSYNILSDYLVQYGLSKSPELRQLDALLDAKERSLTSTRLSYFVPTVSAFANVTNSFYRSVTNSPFQITSLPPLPSSLSPDLPVYLGQLLSSVSPKLPDRNDWSIGVQLSLNLFSGFSTRASEEKGSQELDGLRLQRQSVAEKVALRIRSEMENIKAAYFGIQQSRLEQEAAHKTLDIVTEAYSSGAVSILSLLDAQSSSLRADQVVANAKYDFFIDYMQVQRAVGQFDVFMGKAEREEFLRDLDGSMKKAQGSR
jgi:outer membrane protein